MSIVTKTKFHLENPTNTTLKLICNSCGKPTNHKIAASFHESGEDHDGIDGSWLHDWQKYHQIIQCLGCENVSFRQLHYDSCADAPLESYFPVHNYQHLNNESGSIPVNIIKLYNETSQALSNKLYVLAGVGIRGLIEAVCKDRDLDVKDQNLEKRIKQLKIGGLITQSQAKSLQTLRLMGNEAAHEVKPYTETELLVAFEVIKHLLRESYTLPKLTKILDSNI